MDDLLPIGRFARLTRLTRKALRLYAERGMLVPAVVDFRTGFRYYRAEQADLAARIRALRAVDLPLDEVEAALAASGAGDARAVLARHRRRLEERIAASRQALRLLRDLEAACDDVEKERTMAEKAKAYQCSFCGKAASDVKRMIAGPDGVFICSECVTLCNEIIAKKERDSTTVESPA